jgi:uncharacterized damage-inducible protein DinB
MKQQFLDAYDREHAKTMRVLRNYPADKGDLRPHPKLRTARELAWVFVLERYLGQRVWNDEIAKQGLSGKPPEVPAKFDDIFDALEKAHREFRDVIASASDDALTEKVTFMTGPKQMGQISRIDWLWFLLSDQIHHRGQFTVYLRMADGKVPAVYGPSGDEPWT